MPPAPPTLRTVQPEDWFAAYFIGVTALATFLAVLIMLMMLAGAGPLHWAVILQVLFMGLLTLVFSGMVIGILALLPCVLFFWLAQRFAWRHVLIYLFCGVLGAMPTIPVVESLFPSSFYTDPPDEEPTPDTLARYLPIAPLFAFSGAFMGAVFWWRSGRHLRKPQAQEPENSTQVPLPPSQ
ncbi:hypothetical protein GV819_09530 [Pseudomonas sp. Fl5BN2]|uniref:hypothetical protein n=1 Tax=unclassified Pseudomonas TaxID=196821 RepID=UPI00137682F6|nr:MULTISPECIES: hypothetical protein [unclassified Pseudomonas]NBF02531.1 hypothetical protein [Pseudomonas sp. Fl5BN2]NBF12048.1 hypothetical protein [Pseudomonas sp. Fl4BN1]